jgi:hypothetical protein
MRDHKHYHRILIWIDAALTRSKGPHEIDDDKAMLLHILKGQLVMALNLATLTDDVTKLSGPAPATSRLRSTR